MDGTKGLGKRINKILYYFEAAISVIMIIVILIETVLLVHGLCLDFIEIFKQGGATAPESTMLNQMMNGILWIVIGLEFVRMLIEHSHAAVLEVMLFAIARQMIVAHTSMTENLLAVVAIAGIFVIRKYFYTYENNEVLEGIKRKAGEAIKKLTAEG